MRIGAEIELGSTKIKVIETPCHTSGHISFITEGTDEGYPPVLFPGDTLFVGGCGRFFEGTAAQMLHNMVCTHIQTIRHTNTIIHVLIHICVIYM